MYQKLLFVSMSNMREKYTLSYGDYILIDEKGKKR